MLVASKYTRATKALGINVPQLGLFLVITRLSSVGRLHTDAKVSNIVLAPRGHRHIYFISFNTTCEASEEENLATHMPGPKR